MTKWDRWRQGPREPVCLFSVQSSEKERWNRKMKEQPAYASPEQNPFITSVIFNFQQLYQHLQYSLPKSHMTCSQPTIDKPYGIPWKADFAGDVETIGLEELLEWVCARSRWEITPQCHTGPPSFQFPRWVDNPSSLWAGTLSLA